MIHVSLGRPTRWRKYKNIERHVRCVKKGIIWAYWFIVLQGFRKIHKCSFVSVGSVGFAEKLGVNLLYVENLQLSNSTKKTNITDLLKQNSV